MCKCTTIFKTGSRWHRKNKANDKINDAIDVGSPQLRLLQLLLVMLLLLVVALVDGFSVLAGNKVWHFLLPLGWPNFCWLKCTHTHRVRPRLPITIECWLAMKLRVIIFVHNQPTGWKKWKMWFHLPNGRRREVVLPCTRQWLQESTNNAFIRLDSMHNAHWLLFATHYKCCCCCYYYYYYSIVYYIAVSVWPI